MGDQPRVPAGSPKGGQWTLMHGTTVAAARRIQKEGLLASKSQAEIGVFATPNLDLALTYGATRALNSKSKVPVDDREFAIIHLDPKGFTQRMTTPDPGGLHWEHIYRGDSVKPSNILGIDIYRSGDVVVGGKLIQGEKKPRRKL
jgi:hypothetical protein